MTGAWLCLLLFLLSINSNSSSQPRLEDATERLKIAYIFAGSVRSFVCPKVHWSIKAHLIDGFGGDPYVFVRTTAEDNMNVKTGEGTFTSGKASDEIIEALKILHPKVVQQFSYASELQEMKEFYISRINGVIFLQKRCANSAQAKQHK